VTRHKADTLEPVAARLRARAPALTRRIVARLSDEIPVYAQLPAEELAGDVADIVQNTLRLFADVIARGSLPDPAALSRQRDSAALRAEEGVALDAILSAYQLGAAMCWEDLAADLPPADLCRLTALTFRLQRDLVSAVTAGYLEARQTLDGQEYGDRQALLAALLGAEPLDRFTLAPHYTVLTLRFPAHPDESAPGPRARIAARRKVRRVRATLDAVGPGPVLTALDPGGGTALLPAQPSWPALQDLVAACSEAAGVAITAAAEPADPPDVAAAATRTGEIVDLVRRTARTPGLYRLTDVLLDYQLSRPSAALTALAALLAPLDRKPELLETLSAYLNHRLDRRATAAALHIHPNTVDYRLRRIAALTGRTPTAPADHPLLQAALTARSALLD